MGIHVSDISKKTDKEIAGDIIMLVTMLGNAESASPGDARFTFRDGIEGLHHVVTKVGKEKGGGFVIETFVPDVGISQRYHPTSESDTGILTRDGLVAAVRFLLDFHQNRLSKQ